MFKSEHNYPLIYNVYIIVTTLQILITTSFLNNLTFHKYYYDIYHKHKFSSIFQRSLFWTWTKFTLRKTPLSHLHVSLQPKIIP